MRSLLCCLILLSLVACVGCGDEPPVAAGPADAAPATREQSTHFSPDSCGTIVGLVTWVGPIPEVAPVMYAAPRADGSGHDSQFMTLANAPRIDRFTRGVDGAVVYLREVNAAAARPWDLPPVAVEFRDNQLLVKQGERLTRTGFVRRGDAVPMQSSEARFHLLRGRGAAFFTVPFPEVNKPASRNLDTCGRVELTCAAGCYWQSATLFVCDHPYYAVTDAAGRFQFTHVPAGQYDLVVWHPNWEIIRTERNPENGQPWRLHYAPPLESSRPVAVSMGRSTLANLTLPK